MRIGTDDFFHLTYCTNVHPGEDWEETFEYLKIYLPQLKKHLALEERFGVGLRLSNKAAHELLQGNRLPAFRDWLDDHGFYVFTMNGFPYGAFHGQRVKDQVHAPDWRTPERVQFTVRLADIMAALLPEGMEGSISTSPLSYKPWLNGENETEVAFRESSLHLAGLTAELMRLEERSGTHLHVDLEPEPDGLLENTAETVDFFERWLLPTGSKYLGDQLGLSHSEAADSLRRHIRICYDTCHFALEYEEPADALARLKEHKIRIGKVQLSAALRVDLPEVGEQRDAIRDQLKPFAEHIYLHQVIGRLADGSFRQYADLPEALDHLNDEQAREWRIHYHVPLFTDRYGALASTQSDIVETLRDMRRTHACSHLEIETYTWDVLPPDLKTDLTESIRREYAWVRRQFDT